MRFVALSLIVGLAACGRTPPPPPPEPVFEVSQVAEQTIAAVIAQEFPSSPAEPAANCGIENATDEETDFLGSKGPGAIDEIVTQNVLVIMARPETRACLESNGVSTLS